MARAGCRVGSTTPALQLNSHADFEMVMGSLDIGGDRPILQTKNVKTTIQNCGLAVVFDPLLAATQLAVP